MITTSGIDLYADMHTHTTCSDGILSVEQLLERVETLGLQALSITDHDTMIAHDEIERLGYNGPVEIVPGIEVSCTSHGREVHLLGYWMDRKHPGVQQYTTFFRADRERRAIEMVQRLQRLHVPITFEEVQEEAGVAPITRPHIAAVMVRRGVVRNIQEAFDKYLDTSSPGYVPRSPMTMTDAVTMIHDAGGIAIVAHPSGAFKEARLLLELVSTGIDGIEVYHPSHWYETREFYRLFCKQQGLVVGGGSDFHGSRDYDEKNLGHVGLPKDLYLSLRERAGKS